MPVITNGLRGIGAVRDQMSVPDFLEQGAGHDFAAFEKLAAILVACPIEGKPRWRRDSAPARLSSSQETAR